MLPVESLHKLAGLAALDDLPWLAVLELFESKVDALLAFGICLYALVPDARELVCAMEFSCFSSRLVFLLEKVDSVCLLIPNQTLYYVESLDIAGSF